MIECKICNKKFNYMRGLSIHIKNKHNLSSQDYYDKFFEKGYCKICGKPTNFHNLTLGYYNTCSRGCANNTDAHKDSVANTKLIKYGNKSYNNPQKTSKSLLSRSKSEVQAFINKSKLTKKLKYDNDTYNNPQKRISTMKKNNSIKMSNSEKYCYDKLNEIFSNVEYQYYDNRYNYACDFYIKDIDTFIEINFTWLHGLHRFDINNIEDINKLNLWKEKSIESDYYKKAIEVWTISDEIKYKITQDNKLNYKTFYNKTEFNQWINEISQIH